MTKNSETSTIMVYLDTKAELDKLKVHPNQSYDEVLQKLIESWREEHDSS